MSTEVPKPLGSIIITLSQNPETPLKVDFNGIWTHRQILAAERAIGKGFRQHMMDIKRTMDKETANVEKTS